jgi:hypothetical protein
MIEAFALTSISGVAIFFMLTFLYALLKEAGRSRDQFTEEIRFRERREMILRPNVSRALVSMENCYGCPDRAA